MASVKRVTVGVWPTTPCSQARPWLKRYSWCVTPLSSTKVTGLSSKRRSPWLSISGSGKARPSADGELQWKLRPRAIAYRPLPGRRKRGSGAWFCGGSISSPSRVNSKSARNASEWFSTRSRRLLIAVSRKASSSATPVKPRNATKPRLAASNWRACSESARRAIPWPCAATLFAARDGESITATTHGLDRLEFAFRIQLLPEASDEHLEHVRIAIEVLLVDVLGEVGLRDQLTRVQHQILEHLVLIAGQVDALALHAHGLRGKIQRHRAAIQRRLAPARGAAQQRVDAREQFLDVEGLDEVIVGASLQSLDLVLPRRTRGEDQDGEFLAFGAQVAHQVHARHLGQAQVDHGDVEGQFATVVQAFLAVGGGIHGEAFALQARGKGFAQRGFIFNQQDAHVVSLTAPVRCRITVAVLRPNPWTRFLPVACPCPCPSAPPDARAAAQDRPARLGPGHRRSTPSAGTPRDHRVASVPHAGPRRRSAFRPGEPNRAIPVLVPAHRGHAAAGAAAAARSG